MIENQFVNKNWGNLPGLTADELNSKPKTKKVRTFDRLLLLLSGQFPHAENSLAMRLSVMLCELTSLLSTFAALEYPTGWYLYIVFLIAGHAYSYKYRNQGACLMKLFISLYMLFILGLFFVNLIASPYGTSQALVMLLAGLLVGHSFDLPRRRDLNYSILVSLLLLGFSATIFNTMTFAINLIVYLVFFSQAARLYCLSQSSDGVFVAQSPNLLKAAAFPETKFYLLEKLIKLLKKYKINNALHFVLTFLVSMLIFALIPRFPGLANFRLQTDLNLSLNFSKESSDGELITPSYTKLRNLLFGSTKNEDGILYENGQDDLGDTTLYADSRLNEQLIMQVRTNGQAPIYCRGLAYRHYDGRNWTIDEEFPPREVNSGAFLYPSPYMFSRSFYRKLFKQGWRPKRPDLKDATTQIFYIEHDLNNVIYTPYPPLVADFPTEMIFIDRDNGLRSPNILEKGTVYTTHSTQPVSLITEAQAKQQIYSQFYNAKPLNYEKKIWREALNYKGEVPILGDENPLFNKDFNRWEYKDFLEIPHIITPRTRFLATSLTAQYKDPALKVLALAHFLRSNCAYMNPPPKVPKKVELTDYFIFAVKAGNCRNFASSLAVMCRVIGIPSRYVSGYVAKAYNPFTGNYEIYRQDAHAWTEVFLGNNNSTWTLIDATSPNSISGAKAQGAQLNIKPLLNYLTKIVPILPDINLDDPYVYLWLAEFTLIVGLASWLITNYQAIGLACFMLLTNHLSLRQRLTAADKLIALSSELKSWQKSQFSSEIEQFYHIVLILLADLEINQAPGQTLRQFSLALADTKIGPILQRITPLYEESLYVKNDQASSKYKLKQQNLKDFFEKLSPEAQKDLLELLAINPHKFLRL